MHYTHKYQKFARSNVSCTQVFVRASITLPIIIIQTTQNSAAIRWSCFATEPCITLHVSRPKALDTERKPSNTRCCHMHTSPNSPTKTPSSFQTRVLNIKCVLSAKEPYAYTSFRSQKSPAHEHTGWRWQCWQIVFPQKRHENIALSFSKKVL